jgi:ubiquinone/menaquinone biosynthesis C-methylase UbiE
MTNKPNKTELFKAVGAHLREPKGEMGHNVAAKMNQTNRAMTEVAYDKLNPRPGFKMLEIGFGNGRLLPYLLDRVLPEGKLLGVDISRDMVLEADTFLQKAGYGGNYHLSQSSSTALPAKDGELDGVVAVNAVYFWQEPSQHLCEISRILKPEGRLVISVRGIAYMTALPFGKEGFVLREDQEYRDMLDQSGFEIMGEYKFVDEQLGEIKVDKPAEVIVFSARKK